MTQNPIAITGATGYLGGNVARELSETGYATRLIVRDANRAPDLTHAEVAEANYFDKDAMIAALHGTGRLLFISGSELKDRLESHRTVIDAAKAAGVERVLYTSFLGAGPDAIFTLSADHWGTEKYMVDEGVPYTALRNSFYAEIAEEMVDNGVIKGPGGDGRLAPVARDDVIAAAVGMLTSPDLPEGPLDVTGLEALSLRDIARIYTEVTGKPAKYIEDTLEEAYASRAHHNASPAEMEAWVSTYRAIAAGQLSAVSDVVARYAGHPPMSFADYLRRKL